MNSVSASVRSAVGLVVLALVLGVFPCDALAQGPQAPPSAPVTVVNTTANPVPVTATAPLPVAGTISLTQPVTVEETFAPGRSPKRYGPIAAEFTGSIVGHELVPPVETGKRFILTHLNAVGFSNNSAVALARGSCTLQLRVGSTYTPFMLMPLVNSGSLLTGIQSPFLPLDAGEGLYVNCSGTAADGTEPSQGFRMTAGGYFVPAMQ
jgi:hypothetical protein